MTIRQAWFRSLAIAAAGLVLAAPVAAAIETGPDSAAEAPRPARSEEQTLQALSGQETLRLDTETGRALIHFDIAPGARAEAVELVLVARPDSARSGGRIEAVLNRGRSVVLAPKAERFEARFKLYAESLESGHNTLALNFDAEGAAGWAIDARESRLRLSAAPAAGFENLGDIEAALASDFAAPRRIYLETGQAGDQEAAVAALAAQGLALRMGEAPILVTTPGVAELTVRALADPAAATPVIVQSDATTIDVTASDSSALLAAARLFAARSMKDQDSRFAASEALSAPRLVFAPDNTPGVAADLSGLAGSGAPFAVEQGSRTAVILPSGDPEVRAAALAVVGRAALASGRAWIYGWFGDELDAAPAGHNLLVLGPISDMDTRILAAAPAEVRAATDAAEARTPRKRPSIGSTAYAADPGQRLGEVTGIAAIFADTEDARTIALITAPEGANFARAAKRLARSGLWDGMTGQAVLWDAGAITAFGPTSGPAFSREAFVVFMRDNDRYIAIGAFALAVLLLLSGGAVNRTSSRRA